MKKLISLIITFSLILLPLISVAAPICSSVYTLFSKGRVQIQKSNPLESSILHLEERDFNTDPQKGFMELIYMAASATPLLISEKHVLRKEFFLGLPLKNGYSLEMSYIPDGRGVEGRDARFTLDEIYMVSPSGRKHLLMKKPLTFGSLSLHPDKKDIQLDDVYPQGFHIDAHMPLEITGHTLQKLEKFLPRVELFTMAELRYYSERNQFAKLMFFAHARALKEFLTKRVSRMAVSGILLGVFINPGADFYNHMTTKTPEATPPVAAKVENLVSANFADWVYRSNLSLGLSLGKEAKTETLELRTLLETSLKNQTQKEKVSLDFQQPKMKLDENSYVWLMEKSEIQKTYLVFSRDNEKGAIEYLAVEINPMQYPKTVGSLKRSGLVVGGK